MNDIDKIKQRSGYMREIKFKFWDKSIEQMCFPSGVSINELASHEYFPLEQPKGDWLQYTGLKDKNGNEIYEGDIVRQQSSGTEDDIFIAKGVIEYVGKEFVIKVREGICQSFLSKFCEVMGNVYGNKELIERVL